MRFAPFFGEFAVEGLVQEGLLAAGAGLADLTDFLFRGVQMCEEPLNAGDDPPLLIERRHFQNYIR